MAIKNTLMRHTAAHKGIPPTKLFLPFLSIPFSSLFPTPFRKAIKLQLAAPLNAFSFVHPKKFSRVNICIVR